MNIMPTVEKQIEFLKDKNIAVIDENVIINFLKSNPFQYSIKQLSYLDIFSEIESTSQLIDYYEKLKNDSYHVLKLMLDLEREIKAIVFDHFLEVYDKNKNQYELDINRLINCSSKSREIILNNHGAVSDDEIKGIYEKKVFKFINVLYFKELKMTFDIIDNEHIQTIYLLLKNKFNIGDEKIVKKQYFYDDNIPPKEYKSDLLRNRFIAEIKTIFLDCSLNNTFPSEEIHSNGRLIINLLSKNKINSFFKSNIDLFVETEKKLNHATKKSEKKKIINDLSSIFGKMYDENEECIFGCLFDYYVNDEQKYSNIILNIMHINELMISLNDTIHYKKYFIIKFIAKIESIRNILCHGQMLTACMKSIKEKTQTIIIFNSLESDLVLDYKSMYIANKK